MNVLALALARTRSLQRIDLEEQLFVALLTFVGVDQLGRLVRRLAVALGDLGGNLGFGLFESFDVDLSLTSFDLRGARGRGEAAGKHGVSPPG